MVWDKYCRHRKVAPREDSDFRPLGSQLLLYRNVLLKNSIVRLQANSAEALS